MGGKRGRNNSENVKVREGAEEVVLPAPEKRFPRSVGEHNEERCPTSTHGELCWSR